MTALCENDHPLATGQSRCGECGARIKMQWMSADTTNAPARDLSPPAEPPIPVCENGHALDRGQSRCPACGARIKIQWMRGAAAHVATVPTAQTPDEAEGTSGEGSEEAEQSSGFMEFAPRAAPQVGSIVRARQGLRTETAVILDVRDGKAEVVWPTGEKALLSLGRVKESVLASTHDLRSIPGRLMRCLDGEYTEPHRTAAVDAVLRQRIEELTTVREHAVGLLLDCRPLSLSLSDCLSLPIEPWRVHYEFLRSMSSADEGAREMARAIVSDENAPAGVRTVVALRWTLPLAEVSPQAELVFSEQRPDADGNEQLTSAASMVAEQLDLAGVRSADKLRLAVSDPSQLACRSGAVLSGLERPPSSGTRLEIGPTTPLSVVDDLIDRGIEIDVDATVVGPDGRGTLAGYVAARTDPAQLTSEEVVAIGFEAEAVRRYLAGDGVVEPALPAAAAADVKALRAVITGQEATHGISDPLIEELRHVIASNGAVAPSESLLEDPSVWPALINANVVGSSITGPLGEKFAGVSALTRASAALFEWRWSDARSIARDGLRQARSEEVRDELLNITACALWLQGEPEPALTALDNALEGAYTDALLVNASVVATELEHDSAIDRLVRLAREAPSPHQRAMAAERALILWVNDDERVWEEDEDEDSLPVEIRDALRPLINEALPEDRYLRILRVLASRDGEWLAARPNWAFGKNADRPAARIFRARAAGIDEFVKELAAELRSGSSEDWVAGERDSVVGAAIEVLFERNDELAAAYFGMTVIDADLPMAAEQRIALKCLTAASIAANIDPTESEPNERFIGFIEESRAELIDVDEDDRERLRGLTTLSAESLTSSYFRSRAHDFDAVIDGYNMIMSRVRTIPRRNINKPALREAFAPISRFCTETWDLFNRLRQLIEDEDLIEAVVAMMKQASDIGNSVAEVTR